MELSIEEISKDEWKRIKKHNYKKSFKKKAHLIKEEKAKAYSDGEFFELLEREGLQYEGCY